MLKRQRPATPPSSMLDFPAYFPDRPLKPLPQRKSDAVSLSEPRCKRRRVAPSDAFGGWPTYHQEESDGEEDWVEGLDDEGTAGCSSMPSSSAAPQVDGYRRTNNLLHELHVLHQHRLMFSPSESQCRASSGVSPPSMHRHPYSRGNAEVPLVLPQSSHMKPSIPQSSQRPSRPPYHIPEGQQCSDQAGLHEAQSVWERYEGANRLLGSLFLSRRRELQVAFSPHDASERQQI